MRHLLIPVGFLLLLSACARPQGSENAVDENHDFFVSVAPRGFVARRPRLSNDRAGNSMADCEQALKKAACETDASTAEISADFSTVECSAQSTSYVPELVKIASEMPEKLRPMFCGVERIFISDRIPSTAFASPIVDDQGMYKGGFIGARKSTFLKAPSIRDLASWKEQLAFGGSTEFLKVDPRLVQIDYGLHLSVLDRDGLFYVLVHELGHLVDFKNGVNDAAANATNRNGSWGRLSWKDGTTPLEGLAFFMRDQFCYYGCSHPIDPSKAGEIYRSLGQSGFITTYSGQNVREDFAEFFAWSIMIQEKSAHLVFTIPGDGVVDMNPAFTTNAKIKAKLEFARRIYERN